MFDYSDRDSLNPRNQYLDILGNIFTIVFTVECLIKVLSFGFIVHHNAYLRDGWNWLDFFVVLVG